MLKHVTFYACGKDPATGQKCFLQQKFLKKLVFFRELFFSKLYQFDGKAVPIWKKGCPNLEKRIPQFGKKVVPISFHQQFRRKNFQKLFFKRFYI